MNMIMCVDTIFFFFHFTVIVSPHIRLSDYHSNWWRSFNRWIGNISKLVFGVFGKYLISNMISRNSFWLFSHCVFFNTFKFRVHKLASIGAHLRSLFWHCHSSGRRRECSSIGYRNGYNQPKSFSGISFPDYHKGFFNVLFWFHFYGNILIYCWTGQLQRFYGIWICSFLNYLS